MFPSVPGSVFPKTMRLCENGDGPEAQTSSAIFTGFVTHSLCSLKTRKSPSDLVSRPLRLGDTLLR